MSYQHLTGPQLDEIDARAAHLYEYEPLPDEADIVVGTDVPALLVEIRELTAERDQARRIAVRLEQETARLEDELADLRVLHNRRLPRLLIKTAKDLDQYVGWSTIAEMPDGIWSRESALEDGIPRTWLDRADETGTSALYPEGTWDDSGFIAEQRGWLPRARLGDFAIEWHYGDQVAAYAMLEPLDDGSEAAR